MCATPISIIIFNDNDNDDVSNNLNNEIEDQKIISDCDNKEHLFILRCKIEEGLVNTANQLCVI